MTGEPIDFLRQVQLFSDLPKADLEQICGKSRQVRLAAGELLFEEGSMGQEAFVIQEGLIEIYKISGGQKVELAVRQPGEMIGEISLFESSPRTASGVALTDSVLITISTEQMDQLLRTNPNTARTMLHTVVLRLQSTVASLRQNEKMAQLGSFTAGIAHEINNPSAAVLRGAEQMKTALRRSQQLSGQLLVQLSSTEQQDQVQELRLQVLTRASSPPELSAGTRMDREAALEDWLAARGIPDSWDLAQQLVSLSYDETGLQAAIDPFPSGSLPVLLEWMTAEAETQRLLDEIHQGAKRVADIVKALKSYAYLDQAPTQEIDIHEGLENTLVILRHKLKQGVEVVRDYDRAIPPIAAYGSELNQVWTNLIDNAIDAMQGKGRLTLRTRQSEGWVAVEIEDTGSGIPPEVQAKLFYPFFTSKPVGEGTGLGLNISLKIAQKHGGDIRVFSQPGQTRFTVRLPLGENSRHVWG
jgi:signal transduction histidine kinase